jgi:hypothetical protein
MFTKYFTLVLALLLFCTASGATALAKGNENAKLDRVEKIKQKVFKRGTGARARVSVKLNDGTKLKGYVSESAAEHFTLMRTDEQMGAALKINYRDVAEIKDHGKGMSTTSKVLIGTGIGVGVTVGVLALVFRNIQLGPSW